MRSSTKHAVLGIPWSSDSIRHWKTPTARDTPKGSRVYRRRLLCVLIVRSYIIPAIVYPVETTVGLRDSASKIWHHPIILKTILRFSVADKNPLGRWESEFAWNRHQFSLCHRVLSLAQLKTQTPRSTPEEELHHQFFVAASGLPCSSKRMTHSWPSRILVARFLSASERLEVR